jgi:hypothetical protein
MVFNRFRQTPSEPEEETHAEGEIPSEGRAIQPWYKRPSILAQARTTTELAGNRPPVINLRDHKELDGQLYAIVAYEFHTGVIDAEPTEYVILAGFTCEAVPEGLKQGQPMAIMTGAADIVSRIYEFRDVIDAGTPVAGKFRNAGRAWFFD